MPLHVQEPDQGSDEFLAIRPQFARPGELQDVPRYRLPDGGMDADTAYEVVHDELMLDGRARLNLATFVTTWMEPQARSLVAETLDKNMIDKDEYPQTAELEHRCVSILAALWHAEPAGSAVGTSTIGSSEAAMLGGLALKWRWRRRMGAAGRPTDRPNLVMGSNVQVCWEKFCRYWDVEPRLVPMRDGRYHLTADEAVERCDEDTIAVVAILGSTQDGSYEPVREIADALDRLEAEQEISVPIHVDAASGGFVAPFLDPDLEWDFRVPRVQSINSSGHKYGLVYPGVGWVVWRDQEALPAELVFKVDYLGGETATMAINFSRPGAQVIAQYYTFLRLGKAGYTQVQAACRSTARYLAEEVAALEPFELIGDGRELPVLAFRLADGVENYTVYDVSDHLRQRGWLVPAYAFPPDLEDVHVLRIVVRNGFSRDLARLLLDDLRRATERLGRLDRPLPPIDRPRVPPLEGDGMCRLFGLSAAPHRVRASFWLLEAPDSLLAQSRRNPDGTGLGYFDRDGDPVLDKEPLPAYADPAFTREARHIASTTFVSHIRFATTGGRTVENTHPFAMDDRVFAHNGVIQGLDRLEQRVGDEMRLVHGDTDSERYFALVTKEIRSHGDVVAGIASAVGWIAASLPLSSLNFVLATRDEVWALRYPESHRLYILEREAGGRHGGRALHHASSTLRVHVPRLAEHRSVVVASEPLDDSPDWRLLRSGELARVSSNLTVRPASSSKGRPPSWSTWTIQATGRRPCSRRPTVLQLESRRAVCEPPGW